MKIIEPGYTYELAALDGGDPQTIYFVRKSCTLGNPSEELRTIQYGTTNEEVLKALIHRIAHLQGLNACRENALVLTKLEEALMWLEKRTNDRRQRGVENTPQA